MLYSRATFWDISLLFMEHDIVSIADARNKYKTDKTFDVFPNFRLDFGATNELYGL